MTNPGHVDPGYSGPMRFTVINVGREEIALRNGDAIVTLLFFRLNGNARAGYAQRRGASAPVPGPTQSAVNRLSLDFLDVTGRADTAATEAVKKAQFRNQLWAVVLPTLLSLLAAALFAFINLQPTLSQLKADVEQIKQVLNLKEPKSRLDQIDEIGKLQKQIDEIRGQLQSQSGAQGKEPVPLR